MGEAQFNIDELKKDTLKLVKEPEMLKIQTANKWIEDAKRMPIPKCLFGDLWIEGEVCILFADTNLGKSILAVQIGQSIASGESIPGFSLGVEPKKVAYCDFELVEKQFEKRYSADYTDHFNFSNNLIRITIDPDGDFPDGQLFEEMLMEKLEKYVVNEKVEILIVDNLTYLKNETEKAKDASPLMKKLQNLKKRFGISLLVLAHTPKRDLHREITLNDVQGSKMVTNFCDSAFAIGKSTNGADLRYLKQTKVRSSEHLYGSDNVCVCELIKDHNFLKFNLLGYSTEREHLKVDSDDEKAALKLQAVEMHNKGMSYSEIAKELGFSDKTIKKWIVSENLK